MLGRLMESTPQAGRKARGLHLHVKRATLWGLCNYPLVLALALLRSKEQSGAQSLGDTGPRCENTLRI